MILASTLVDQARQALKDTSPDSTKQKRSDAIYLSNLNSGMNDFVELTKCLVKQITFTPIAEQEDYDTSDGFPADFLGLHPLEILDNRGGIIYNGTPLELFTIAQLDYQYPGWRSATSGLPDKFAIDNFSTLYLSVKPSSANVGSNYIKMRYIPTPTQFTTGNMATIYPFNDVPRLTSFNRAPLFYALSELFFIDGDEVKSKKYRELYEVDVEKANRYVTQSYPRKGGFKPSRSSSHSMRTPYGD